MDCGKLILPQPFRNGLKTPLPGGRKKELNKIRTWLAGQAHLPNISDEYIYLFLHSRFYNVDRTKHAIDSYFTIRTNSPTIFGNRNLNDPTVQFMFGLAQMAIVPQRTKEGYTILIYRLKDNDYRKMIFHEALKAFLMVNDCILSEEGLHKGYIIIFDMKGIQLGHMARVALPPLRIFIQYIMDAHPALLHHVHVINTPQFAHHVIRLATPLIKQCYWDLITFHNGSVPAGVPIDLLPSDYGGKERPLVEIHDELYTRMMKEYPEWMLQNEQIKVDETKRVKKFNWLNLIPFGGTGSKDHPSFKLIAEID